MVSLINNVKEDVFAHMNNSQNSRQDSLPKQPMTEENPQNKDIISSGNRNKHEAEEIEEKFAKVHDMMRKLQDQE